MRRFSFAFWGLVFLIGCGRQEVPTSTPAGVETPAATPAEQTENAIGLSEARNGFVTKIVNPNTEKYPVPEPPAEVFRLVKYPSPVGELAAYLTPDPNDGQRHPAIIWITGGDSNTIGELWEEADPSNDQTASAFRKAGIVLMFPSLRGGNENPGTTEGFFGEVDDIQAAAEFLGQEPYVDPQRIYLGGHSTGGTLVLLVAECTDRFRAVFSFGPVEDVAGYGGNYSPFDTTSKRELELRAPIRWLHSIKSPVFVFEGTQDPANIESLQLMARASTNPMIRFLPVEGANHFSILAPVSQLIAKKLLNDKGPASEFTFSEMELNQLFTP